MSYSLKSFLSQVVYTYTGNVIPQYILLSIGQSRKELLKARSTIQMLYCMNIGKAVSMKYTCAISKINCKYRLKLVNSYVDFWKQT